MAKRKILKEFVISEISAVDWPAQKGARAVLMKRGADPSLGKRQHLLASVDGHAHILVEEDFHGMRLDAGETSWAVSEGAETGHSHPWIRREDGSILIGEAEGHTHEIQATTKRAGGNPMPKTPEELTKELEKAQGQIEKLTADNEAQKAALAKAEEERDLAKAKAAMSDKERKAMDDMDEEERKKFLKASPEERAAVLAKHAEADPVVYTAKDGTEYRKSDGRLAEFAKRDDAREEEMAKARAEAEDARIEKRITSEFPNFPDPKAAGAILKAVGKIEDEEVRKAAEKLLAGAHAALDRFTKMEGHRGGETDPSITKAATDFDAKVAEIRKRDQCSYQEAMQKARNEHPDLFKRAQGEDVPAEAA